MIILTRGETGAHKTAQFLRSHGFSTIAKHPLLAFSFIETADVSTPASDIIFTSANGVRALAQLGVKPSDQRVWCVGAATAGAASAQGWRNIQTSGGNANTLADYILSKTDAREGNAFIHYANAAAKSALPDRLNADGLNAHQVFIYEMKPVLDTEVFTTIQSAKTATIVVFHSRAAAHVFADLCADSGNTLSQDTRAIAYAKPIAAALEGIIGTIDILDTPDDDALLTTLRQIK